MLAENDSKVLGFCGEDMGWYQLCARFTGKDKVTEAGTPADVKELFNKYAEGCSHMTVEQLWRFLVEDQGESGLSITDAEQIVEQVLQRWHHIARFTRRSLTLGDFHHYLFSTELNPPIGNQVFLFLVYCKLEEICQLGKKVD